MPFNFKSIKVKYMIIGLAIVIVSLAIIASFSYIVSSDIVANLSDKWINQVVLRNSETIDNWFIRNENMIDSMAKSIELEGDFSYSNLEKQIKNKMQIYEDEVVDFYIGFEQERKIISGVDWEAPPDYDARDRSWYKKAKKADNVIFTEPYVDAMTGEMIITVAEALHDGQKLVGVLAKDIYLTDIVEFVNNNSINKNSYGMLLDENGKIIVHPADKLLPDSKGLKSVSEVKWDGYHKLVNNIKSENSKEKIEITGYNQNEKEFVYHNRIETTGWYYTTSISKRAYEKPLKNLVSGFFWAVLFSVIIAILIMYKLIQSIIKPIESLNNTVQKFSSNNMSVRTNVLSEDEIGKLGQSFNQMADTIEDYSNSLERKVEEKTRKIRDKNKTIMESIDYASRIQNSIIPDLSKCINLDEKDYFSIWQPREKVGGDIFWCKSAGNYSVLAVVDCTGHGVPGAFMSMMLSSILNSVIKDFEPTNPAKILNEVDIRLKENLSNKKDKNINDGADMALVVIDKNNGELIFSGAKLDMYKVQNKEAEKIKGSRRSIGYSLSNDNFTNKKIKLKSDENYYFTTDGYLDQNSKDSSYGIGKNGFTKLLEKIADKSISQQKEFIKKDIENKISQVEQRDDITVIALNLSKFTT